MNALKLLHEDHRKVEGLFSQFETLGSSGKKRRQQIAQSIVKELSVHAAIEELLFYPMVRRTISDAHENVLEALEEHHVVKWLLSEIEGKSGDDERLEAKVKVLAFIVRRHVEEEEKQIFPKVRRRMSAKQLEDLGKRLEAAKRMAPTRPHPRVPDSPPGNLFLGKGLALMDHARDETRRMVQRVTHASALNRLSRSARKAKATGKSGKAAKRNAEGKKGGGAKTHSRVR
jgi:hemerythrin superfamily protein